MLREQKLFSTVGDGTNKKAREFRQVRRNNGRLGQHFNDKRNQDGDTGYWDVHIFGYRDSGVDPDMFLIRHEGVRMARQ